MNGINKVILLGNVGNEPEIRTTQSGKNVANLSIATSENYTDAQGNQNQRTEWHRIVLWGKLADVVAKYVHKGSCLFIEGKITSHSYTDKENIKRTAYEIIAENMQMVGKPKSAQDANQDYNKAPAPYGDAPYGEAPYGQNIGNSYGQTKAPVNGNAYGNAVSGRPQNYGNNTQAHQSQSQNNRWNGQGPSYQPQPSYTTDYGA